MSTYLVDLPPEALDVLAALLVAVNSDNAAVADARDHLVAVVRLAHHDLAGHMRRVLEVRSAGFSEMAVIYSAMSQEVYDLRVKMHEMRLEHQQGTHNT